MLSLRLYVSLNNFFEFLHTCIHYYRKTSFAKIDLQILSRYLLKSPFNVSKQYLLKQGASDPYQYGETPLSTWEKIVKRCKIQENDTFYELGCGRARTCFWLHSFIGCKVTGIDQVPHFIHTANHIANKNNLPNLTFHCENILDIDYNSATVLYLYGSNFEDDTIKQLIETLKTLKTGARVITVSYPLADYTSEPLFFVADQFEAKFPWGKASVYVNVRQNKNREVK